MKKKILIVVPSFAIGGTIVSLHSLLSVIDSSKYQVDVFALNREGEYLDKLPNCQILPDNMWLSHSYRGTGAVKRFCNKILRIARAAVRRLGLSIEPLMCRFANKQVKFSQYDTLINFAESVTNIVCHYPVGRRVTWVHCDYERYLSLIKRDEKAIYTRFDTVVCVSEFAKSVFCKCMPHMKDKAVAIHNVINVENIKAKAQEPIDDKKFTTDSFTIVSAGRLDPVKQFHLIPQLAAEIKKLTDKKFVWYIIGGARGFDSYVEGIKNDIIHYAVADEVVMLGEKSNVYPYMAKANLYVSTSLSESFPLVINEAKALGIPIVSNNFGSAAESVQEGVDGYIASVKDENFIKAIVSIIQENVKLSNTSDLYFTKNRNIIDQVNKIL